MSSATVTRMLVLGVVSLFQPVNGYQILRELQSWHVEEWAQVKPGSIYSMLTSLTKQERLIRHDLTEADRAVAVYEISTAGADDLHALVEAGLTGASGRGQDVFQAAMSFSPLLSRGEVAESLRRRATLLGEYRLEVEDKIINTRIPPHVRQSITLDHALVGAELVWLEEFITLIEQGSLWFEGEAGNSWTPPPEDAGWEMVDQSQRYRLMIGSAAQTTRKSDHWVKNEGRGRA